LCPIAASADAPAGTFSIIGIDRETGEIGVAVQSRAFNVGRAVAWARARVGAIATQAQTNISNGPNGLDLMATGMKAPEVLAALVASDTNSAHRQIGVMDATGACDTWTGAECGEWAGGQKAPGKFVCQGNILAGPEVVAAMARGFESAQGELSIKLLAALDSAQAAGGDRRGKQSAALLVVRPSGSRPEYETRYVDLRVEDHPDPIVEIRRLYGMHEGVRLFEAHMHYLSEAERAGDRKLAGIEKERINAMMTRALAEWQDPMRLNGVAWECAIRDLYLNDAVALARRAVQLDSTNVDILDTLAEALYRSGDADSAIVVAERAVALDPLSKYLQDQLERFHKPREATRTSR
jgi:uncharacterized Ntn-hydrolase superfamily protein